MSGAHLPITEKPIWKAREEGLEEKMIVVRGVIPARAGEEAVER